MFQNMQGHYIDRRHSGVIMKIIKMIPFVIPVFAYANILFVKVASSIKTSANNMLILKVTEFIFNPRTPLYFNYWPVYMLLAIILIMILAFLKKYSALTTLVGIGFNLILSFIMLTFAITRM